MFATLHLLCNIIIILIYIIINNETDKNNLKIKRNIKLQNLDYCYSDPKTVANTYNHYFVTISSMNRTSQ